jgi:glycopeptide antibiotics resistance protein
LPRTVSARLLLLYAAVVLILTVPPIAHHRASYWGGEPWWTEIEFVPFTIDVSSFMLNIIMFMPFGALVALVWPRADSYWRILGYGLAASIGIETVQLILNLTVHTRRTVDINDIISNVLGALAGLALLRLALPRREQRITIGRRESRRRGGHASR